jgi:hypothetical protein
MPLRFHVASFFVNILLNITLPVCPLHVLFTAPHLASVSSPQQQQVSHACACDGACGKYAEPALLALCVEQPCNPMQQQSWLSGTPPVPPSASPECCMHYIRWAKIDVYVHSALSKAAVACV